MKTSKPLWRISIQTTLEAEDAVAELLGAIFSQPASLHFNVETQVSVVSIFRSARTVPAREIRDDVSAELMRIKNCGLNIGSGRIKIARVRREDWSESWKRHFKPVEIGRALLIKPSWVRRPPRKDQAVVILDPGLSFGTGQHATTSFCLHQIVAAIGDRQNHHRPSTATPKSFLDIGTGSGILAIAAAKLGYQPVRALDFDPEAVRIARANARMNQTGQKIKIVRGDVAALSLHPARKYDLVCANLISTLLIAEWRRIVAQMDRGGILVLAGILRSEFGEVQQAYENSGLELLRCKIGKEWRSGSFRFTTR
jgi:ribosomal protein L11 methyltransferase